MSADCRIPVLLLTLLLHARAQTAPPGNVETGKAGLQASLKVGGPVSAPSVIYAPDPQYSKKAQKAHYEGTCVLWLVVGADGRPRDIQVARALGMGLDEQAIEAVRAWRFKPASKDGQPVAVQINVEVEFRLFGPRSETNELWKRADAGDARAQLKLARGFLTEPYYGEDEQRGLALLTKAANQGLPEAQFRMGEHAYGHGNGSPDYVSAYMWYALARQGGYKRSEKALKEVASRMTPDQLAEAQKRVESWTSDRDK